MKILPWYMTSNTLVYFRKKTNTFTFGDEMTEFLERF